MTETTSPADSLRAAMADLDTFLTGNAPDTSARHVARVCQGRFIADRFLLEGEPVPLSDGVSEIAWQPHEREPLLSAGAPPSVKSVFFRGGERLDALVSRIASIEGGYPDVG